MGIPNKEPKKDINKIEEMSFAGVGNAAVGTLTADALKNIFTPLDSMPATKGDIKRINSYFQRYHRILNVPKLPDGRIPCFDMQTKRLVYLKA